MLNAFNGLIDQARLYSRLLDQTRLYEVEEEWGRQRLLTICFNSVFPRDGQDTTRILTQIFGPDLPCSYLEHEFLYFYCPNQNNNTYFVSRPTTSSVVDADNHVATFPTIEGSKSFNCLVKVSPTEATACLNDDPALLFKRLSVEKIRDVFTAFHRGTLKKQNAETGINRILLDSKRGNYIVLSQSTSMVGIVSVATLEQRRFITSPWRQADGQYGWRRICSDLPYEDVYFTGSTDSSVPAKFCAQLNSDSFELSDITETVNAYAIGVFPNITPILVTPEYYEGYYESCRKLLTDNVPTVLVTLIFEYFGNQKKLARDWIFAVTS